MANRDLESWARIAEIVGAFAIVVSLVYVALELRESNRILQVSSRQALSEQDLRFYESARTVITASRWLDATAA